MESYSYKTILARARTMKKSVESEQKVGVNVKWSYYFAQSILNPKKDIEKIGSFAKAPKPAGDYISNQIYKNDYLDVCKKLVKFVENHKRLPNYVSWNGKKIRTRDYAYNLAKILVYFADHKELPNYNNINTKIWVKPKEYPQEGYDYLVKKTGKKFKTLDDLLAYIRDYFNYEFYSDDKKSNKEVIDSRAGNCTDLLQMVINAAKAMGYDCKCIHVECRASGIGHVWGKFKHKVNTENTWINRDPSAVCGNSVRNMWCEDGYLLATDPSWFLENLNR